MKYLFTILAFVILCSAVTLYYLLPSNLSESQDVALSINGHLFSQEQLDDQHRREGYHSEDSESSMDSLVTRQLLLDEAQRLGLDKEDAFRKALKNYYEQSLIKILVDRNLQSIAVDVSEEDIDRYISCSGKMFTFTRIPMAKGKLLEEQSRQNSVLFDDLSESLRLVLATLLPGERIVQFETGTEVGVILLNNIETVDGFEPVVYERSSVRELLGNYQKSFEIDRWINGLRKKATIIVYDEEEKND
jgi:hypothetical protein